MHIELANVEDADAILELQKLCYQSEAALYDDYSIPPLTQTLESMRNDILDQVVLKALSEHELIGSVRAYESKGSCLMGRLIVHPEFQNQGIGKELMKSIEAKFSNVKKYELFTGKKSIKNLALYRKLGYRDSRVEKLSASVSIVYLEKAA